MEKRIKFLKLFGKIEEGELYQSIIAFRKRPYSMVRVSGSGPTFTSTVEYEDVVDQYEYHLHVNLWIVVLNFRWLWKKREYRD